MDTAQRTALLQAMAAAVMSHAEAILAANERDLAAARDKGLGAAMLDRLMLDPPRLHAMADAITRPRWMAKVSAV